MNNKLSFVTASSLIVILLISPLLTPASSDLPGKADKPDSRSDRKVAKAVSSSPANNTAARRTRQADARGQSETQLGDGRLLIVGGEGANGPISEAGIKSAGSGEAVVISSTLQQGRAWHTATMLADGSVLILGGTGADGRVIEEAELFDTETQRFESLPVKLAARAHHTSSMLTSGEVLMAGGISPTGETSDKAQLWNPRTREAVTLAEPLNLARRDHSSRLLADGRVLLWGGVDGEGKPLQNGEIFDPDQRSFTLTDAQPVESEYLRVEGSVPEDGAEGVAIDSLVGVRFSRPLRVDSINPTTLTLRGPQGELATKVVAAEVGRLAFVTPQSPLAPSTPYTLSIAGPSDAKGEEVESTVINFTTSSQGAPRARVWIPGADNYNGDWRSKLLINRGQLGTAG